MPRDIIKNRQVVKDHWIHLSDGESATTTKFIVSLTRWKEEGRDLLAKGHNVGVRLEATDDARELADDVPELELIALNFEKFTDGRSYSHARILREHLGYRGELRAVGDVLRDQLFIMARCGINAFEMRSDQNPEESLRAFETFSVRYQAAADQRYPAFRRTPEARHSSADLTSRAPRPAASPQAVKDARKSVLYPPL